MVTSSDFYPKQTKNKIIRYTLFGGWLRITIKLKRRKSNPFYDKELADAVDGLKEATAAVLIPVLDWLIKIFGVEPSKPERTVVKEKEVVEADAKMD